MHEFLLALVQCYEYYYGVAFQGHLFGALAQLGERMAGSHEVRGSIPLGSTIFRLRAEASLRPLVFASSSSSHQHHDGSSRMKTHLQSSRGLSSGSVRKACASHCECARTNGKNASSFRPSFPKISRAFAPHDRKICAKPRQDVLDSLPCI